jgi:DNA-binding transcriptional LysR family regulator
MGIPVRRSEQVGDRLKLPQLKVLLAVARTGSMGKAAKQLATSQSVVSKSISELEDALGVRLFDRNAKGVEPTRYGHSLLKRAVAVFDELRTSVREIEFLTEPGSGELHIGTTDQHAPIVVTTIERLSRQYPRIEFRVVLAEQPTLIERELQGRRIDLMIGALQTASEIEDIETTFLYNNRLRVVVGMKSRWARRRKVALSDLTGEPWCVPRLESPGGKAFANAFRASGLPMPHIVLSTASQHLRRQLLADGRFVGLSADGILHFDIYGPSLKVLPIELPMPQVPIGVLTLKRRTLSPVAQLFIDCIREVVAPLNEKSAARRGHR